MISAFPLSPHKKTPTLTPTQHGPHVHPFPTHTCLAICCACASVLHMPLDIIIAASEPSSMPRIMPRALSRNLGSDSLSKASPDKSPDVGKAWWAQQTSRVEGFKRIK